MIQLLVLFLRMTSSVYCALCSCHGSCSAMDQGPGGFRFVFVVKISHTLDFSGCWCVSGANIESRC